MTIVDIEVLLHYYYSPEAYSECTPAVEIALKNLRGHGLLQTRPEKSQYGSEFEVTAKGHAWVDAIRDTPLPIEVTKWVIPGRESC